MVSRDYQSEIVKQARSENLIACLPTGSGKTLIATLLIKEYLSESRGSLGDDGKRPILLVKTGNPIAFYNFKMKVISFSKLHLLNNITKFSEQNFSTNPT